MKIQNEEIFLSNANFFWFHINTMSEVLSNRWTKTAQNKVKNGAKKQHLLKVWLLQN